MATPRYSVVITAHNAARTIGPCLMSVARQEGVTADEVEIVIVDDRSTDDTFEAARGTGLPNLVLMRIDEPAPGQLTTRQKALDRAFRSARGDIALTLDADGIAAPGWLRAMVGPIERGEKDAVAGAVSFRADRGWLGAWQTVDQTVYLSFCRILAAVGLDAGVLFGNFAFKRSLYAKTGGFERIGYTLTEDLAFSRALLADGARIGYVARADVDVEACASWGILIERAKRVSAGGASPLAAAIGLWMASLVFLAVAAAVFGGWAVTAFGARYLLGVLHAIVALLRAGQGRLMPLALLYEPVAIGIGLIVGLKLTRNSKVEWGGNRYER